MLISRAILEDLFDEALPQTTELAKGITMHAFEVEGIDRVGDDEVLDIDVLPNRAHDCLSHYGIAGEIARIFNVSQKKGFERVSLEEQDPESLEVAVNDESAERFIVATVEGLAGGTTPEWLSQALVSLGERPVSPIVDVLNYAMLLTGQPLHAYDLDALEKQEGAVALTSREAQPGETCTLLDGEQHEFSGGELVIAGAKNILGVAGIKGGSDTAVTEHTTRIALEAATFSPARVRRTAQNIKTRTQASKRFENHPSSHLAAQGITEALRILSGVYQDTQVTALRDKYPQPASSTAIDLDLALPSKLLGVEVDEKTTIGILERIGCEVETSDKRASVTPPFERLDLTIPEDLIEEIGRLYGYEHVQPASLPTYEREDDRSILKVELALKRALARAGYSEIMTRAFRNDGEIEIANPLANQEPFLRTELTRGLVDALRVNVRNAELLGKQSLRIFEAGSIFPESSERRSLALGVTTAKGAQEKVSEDAFKEETEGVLSEALQISPDTVRNARMNTANDNGCIVLEFDATALYEAHGINVEETTESHEEGFNAFKDFSSFPFVLRDIAVWTPEGTEAQYVESIIHESAGDLLQRMRLFDRFEKIFDDDTKRISYAFRLVFQSFERTLSDEEVNGYMTAIESALAEKEGFEIR